MKKTIGLIVIVAVMLLVFVGGVFAAAGPAIANSEACNNVPPDSPARANANSLNSVLGSCEPE